MILKEKDEAYLADFAQYIKKRIDVPVIVVGGIRSMPIVEGILKEKQADYISMARPFIREPHLVKTMERLEIPPMPGVSHATAVSRQAWRVWGISCYWKRMLEEKRRKA